MNSVGTYRAAEVVAPTAELRSVIAEMRREIEVLRRRDAVRETLLREWRNQLDHAARIQRQIEGDLPALQGASLSVFTHPADRVSGDFHVVRRTSPRTVVLSVADATGHGLAAGLIAAAVKGMMAHALRTPCPAADVLDHLNGQLLGYAFSECEFVTAALAEYDEPTRLLRWARAGGPPPILIRDGSAPRRMVSEGLPLGIQADATFVPAQFQLQPGDAVLLHTDGLEALHSRTRGIRSDVDFLDWVAAHVTLGFAEFVKAPPRGFGASHALESDDITSLVLRVGV